MTITKLSEEVKARRTEELEALNAYYVEDLSSSLLTHDDNDDNNNNRSSTNTTTTIPLPLEGPWFILLRQQQQEQEQEQERSDVDTYSCSSLGIPTLEIRLPPSYPLGSESPEPILHNVMMNPVLKSKLLQELKDMHEAEIDVGILWGERCREELVSLVSCDENDNNNTIIIDKESSSLNDNNKDQTTTTNEVRTFIPPTTRYNQPIRYFPSDVITNPKFKRLIVRTPPFHPPKSGPSETMVAHVAEVTSLEEVQWVLAELLFNDKKVAKATHNMFAYRFFTKDSILMSDNDDDGEKGSGAKLASLLELSHVENVLLVVSRWYGGVLLGPARFKYIAGVGRDGLVQAGFIGESSK